MGFMDSFKQAAPPDKKPGMVVAVGVGKPASGDRDQPGGSDGQLNPAEQAAVRPMMDALNRSDEVAFGRALKAFVSACYGSQDSDQDADDAPPAAAKPPMPGMK